MAFKSRHRVEYMTPPSQAINSWLTVNMGTNQVIRDHDRTWTRDLRIYVQHSYLLTFRRWPFITHKILLNELYDCKFNHTKKIYLRASASGSGSSAPNNEAYSAWIGQIFVQHVLIFAGISFKRRLTSRARGAACSVMTIGWMKGKSHSENQFQKFGSQWLQRLDTI